MVALAGVTVVPVLSMVTPKTKRRDTAASYRFFTLVASSLMIVGALCVIFAANDIRGNESRPISSLESELYRGMPDPVQAVREADYTVQSVLPFHALEEEAGMTAACYEFYIVMILGFNADD